MRAKTGFALFDDDRVFHTEILFQTGLFENGVKRAHGNVNIRFARNSHSATFRRMFELAMTTFRPGQVPTILFKLLDEVTNFHARMISNLSKQWKPPNGGDRYVECQVESLE